MYHSHDTEKHLTLSVNKNIGSREMCSLTGQDREATLFLLS